MSIQLQLIESLEKLSALHQSLLHLAEKKTEVIKVGDISGLNDLIKDEQTHIKAIEMMNERRQHAANALQKQHQLKEATISAIIPKLDGPLQMKAHTLQNKLTEQLISLKEINELNQQLLEQSLQYVWLNLDLMTGDINSSGYSKTLHEESSQSTNHTLFESKA
ncbi:flagellar protein FlgN [Falsibacillus albus]|uniref:Flagellar protein FlgN n=1 Tax=Falsibacillus albus TaxID=2478915 RepID=A0A3L7K144_9BACI|nr:flagellar protein FlgN [Falsibacillus albus]RLQ96793.1 flagellar protein FlgN [Falsibacillus albus]